MAKNKITFTKEYDAIGNKDVAGGKGALRAFQRLRV